MSQICQYGPGICPLQYKNTSAHACTLIPTSGTTVPTVSTSPTRAKEPAIGFQIRSAEALSIHDHLLHGAAGAVLPCIACLPETIESIFRRLLGIAMPLMQFL